MCGCEGREHRTGYCRKCWPAVVAGEDFRSTTHSDGSVTYRTLPPMPDRWEGDDN